MVDFACAVVKDNANSAVDVGSSVEMVKSDTVSTPLRPFFCILWPVLPRR